MRTSLAFSVATASALSISCQRTSSGTGAASAREGASASTTSPSADPAGQKFDAWLSAINAADRAAIERVYPAFASLLLDLAQQSGGFDVHHVVEATRTERVALVRSKRAGEWRCLKFEVEPDSPHNITMAMLGSAVAPNTPPGEKQAEPLPALDDQARRDVIDRLVGELNRTYVFPDKVPAIEHDLRERQTHQAYDKLEGRLAFGRAVSQDLQRVSQDHHLRIEARCDPSTPPAPSPDVPSAVAPGGPPAPPTDRDAPPTGVIGSTQRLDGNIAYIEIAKFGEATQAVSGELGQAMNRAADAAAIIFDLRQNGGGHEDNVKLVASYLFGNDPVLLSTIYRRVTNRTDPVYTDPHVPGAKFGPEKPVYILTSRRTFSAPESFAYDLQALKRAIIVGEVTGGGAHPGDVSSLSHGMTAFIPNGRPVNPVTKTDWEGVGVKPDVAVPADKALETAHQLARARAARRP